MSFKSFIAAAVVAATSAIAPVQAMPEGGAELQKALDQAGVEYTSGDCKPHGINGVFGFFHPIKNWIHVCTDVATTEEQQWETFRHEAVHAAQFCVNSSMSFTVMSSKYLLENGRQSDWDFIQRAYDKEDWAIELEAFTLARMSNQAIAELVDAACN